MVLEKHSSLDIAEGIRVCYSSTVVSCRLYLRHTKHYGRLTRHHCSYSMSITHLSHPLVMFSMFLSSAKLNERFKQKPI